MRAIGKSKQGVGQGKEDGFPNFGGDTVKSDGQTPPGPNRRTGLRNRCYRRDREYPLRETPRGGGVCHPRIAVRLANHLIPQFPWRPRFRPRNRGMWIMRRQRVNVSNYFRPLRMWGDCSCFPTGTARCRWTRAPRPIWFVFVGLRTIVASRGGRSAVRYRPIRYRRAFASGMAVSAKYVAQRMFRWVSLGARAFFPRLRWIRISERYCARTSWRRRAAPRISREIC